MGWRGTNRFKARQFQCGFCNFTVASELGYASDTKRHYGIFICPNCERPTFFDAGDQTPGVAPGKSVDHLPNDVGALYEEARRCVAANSPTAAVLTCRKLLVNIAVSQQAPQGQTFLQYVDYLAANGYVPPNGRVWVDHIRRKGNEANHEIHLMSQGDAMELVEFAEMLLKFIYEFPNRVPKTVPGAAP